MNCPLISIIIPVYNADLYLRRTLDSIICQKYERWECILVDDGSKDSSGVICDEYSNKDSRFRVIHKINGGVSSARNVGLQEAKGEWITFCDSDDEFFPETLEIYSSYFDKVDGIKSGYMEIYKSGRQRIDCIPENKLAKTKEDILTLTSSTHYSGILWDFCVKAGIAKKHRFYEDISWCEDHIFVYECMYDCITVAFINSVLYKYHINDMIQEGNGTNLSKVKKNPYMIIKSAEIERQVKRQYKSCTYDDIQRVYKAKVIYALYCSFFTLSIKDSIQILINYLDSNITIFCVQYLRYIKSKLL